MGARIYSALESDSMWNKIIIFSLIISCLLLVSSEMTLAQTTGGGRTSGGTSGTGYTEVINLQELNPLGSGTTFEALIKRVTTWLVFYIAPPIMVLMIIIGAFQIMAAGGNPEKITNGRKTIMYAVIGYALLLVATGIVSIIEQVLGVKK